MRTHTSISFLKRLLLFISENLPTTEQAPVSYFMRHTVFALFETYCSCVIWDILFLHYVFLFWVVDGDKQYMGVNQSIDIDTYSILIFKLFFYKEIYYSMSVLIFYIRYFI